MADTLTQIIPLLTAATATTSAPSSSSDGAEIPRWWGTDEGTIYVQSTDGADTMTCKVRMWGYQPRLDEWFDLGLLNAGADIAETDTDSIRHQERISGLAPFTRLHGQLTAIGGTSTAITVSLGRARGS